MSVIFDQLRVSDDGKQMFINFHINTASYFENVYLKSITIMTSDKISETDPYAPTTDYIYKKEYPAADQAKSDSLALKSSDFVKVWEIPDVNKMKLTAAEMYDSLFFVYVEVQGLPSSDIPCGFDKSVVVGVTFNEGLVHQMIMGFTRELANDCIIPVGFSDFILLWYAFKAAVRTGHYLQAIKFFNMLISDSHGRRLLKTSKCGCHG